MEYAASKGGVKSEMMLVKMSRSGERKETGKVVNYIKLWYLLPLVV